jgi:hypothetical protein
VWLASDKNPDRLFKGTSVNSRQKKVNIWYTGSATLDIFKVQQKEKNEVSVLAGSINKRHR